MTPAIGMVLVDIENEKPIRYFSQEPKAATNNFAEFLGKGASGKVYEGNLRNENLPGRRPVAVEVLEARSDQKVEDQFLAELRIFARARHVNLVQLLGFCYDADLQDLVYEYMEEGCLAGKLFSNGTYLAWETLCNIAVGTAKVIAYLHEGCDNLIIYYDMKAANIPLDKKFCPKVADFGLALLFNREKKEITLTHFSGTIRYAAPDLYIPTLPLTHKCDVYSFGMLLFEILGRRRKTAEAFPGS
ncbi:hypothetical protein SLE2022_272270 [Rubroshorea leprosula]